MQSLIQWVLDMLSAGRTAAEPVYTPVPRPEDDTAPYNPVPVLLLNANDFDPEDTAPMPAVRLQDILPAHDNEGLDTSAKPE